MVKKGEEEKKPEEEKKGMAKMGAVKTALLTVAGLALAWFTMEIAFKPHLDKGRSAMGKALDPNYDSDDGKVDRSTEYERDSDSSSDEEEVGTPPKKK